MPHAGAGTWVLMNEDPLIAPVPMDNELDAREAVVLAGPGWHVEFIERGGL